jgi:hypothetical protein
LVDYKKINDFRYWLKPDYILTIRNTSKSKSDTSVLLIADAKYKQKPVNSDIKQMITYLTVSGWEKITDHPTGIILHMGNVNEYIESKYLSREREPDLSILTLCLRPDNRTNLDEFKNIIQDLISHFIKTENQTM